MSALTRELDDLLRRSERAVAVIKAVLDARTPQEFYAARTAQLAFADQEAGLPPRQGGVVKPEGRAWRKAWRSANKRAPRGRRHTHQAETNPPRRRSSWLRRHPGEWAYYRANAR